MKLQHGKFDITMDILSLAVVVGTAVFLIIRRSLFHMAVGADLLIPMAFSWVFFALLTVVEWLPKIWNTGVTVTEENRARVYAALLHLLTSMKLMITAFFSGMALVEHLPAWCVVAGLALILANFVYWHTRLKKA